MRLALQALMRQSTAFADLVVDVADMLIKGYHQQLLPAVRVIPLLADLLQQAVIADPARAAEIETLLRDIIAHPTQPRH